MIGTNHETEVKHFASIYCITKSIYTTQEFKCSNLNWQAISDWMRFGLVATLTSGPKPISRLCGTKLTDDSKQAINCGKIPNWFISMRIRQVQVGS